MSQFAKNVLPHIHANGIDSTVGSHTNYASD
jgi:hypothetical protein